jgi:hypothetical protein
MVHRALRLPIEPLSQAAWQRVERAVWNRLGSEQPIQSSPRPPRIALLLAAAVLGVSALVVVTAAEALLPKAAETAVGELARTTDDINISAPVGQAVSEGATRALTPPPAVDSAEDQPVITTASDSMTRELGNSKLVVAGRSEIRYRGNDADGWLVLVESGSVHCEVAPREGRPDFVVRAGSAEVRVVGTRFDVSHRAGHTSVSVDEGKVRVLDHGRETLLRAGEKWPVPNSNPAVAPKQKPTATVTGKHSAASGSAREGFELAASLESSEPARALSIYRKLSNSRGAWASNALYAQARLLRESGRDMQANSLLSRYLKLYPRGANSADARRLLNPQPAGSHSTQ